MGKDGRSTRAGLRVLLVATAIQGLTPDYGNLASSWLLRLVSAGSSDGMVVGGGNSSRPTPLPDDDAGGVPGEICGTVAATASLRVRLDDGGRHFRSLLPAGLLERPIRSSPRSLLPPGLARRGPHGLISSLCRLLC